MVSRSWLGTWMPTVLFPAMRSIKNALGAHGETKVFSKPGHAAVFDPGLGLEFIRSDHRAGVDLNHLPGHVELGAFLYENFGFFAKFVLAHCLWAGARVQQSAGRQLESTNVFRSHRSEEHTSEL